VPANRSRTERWRECLRQIHERDGGLEISIPSLPSALDPATTPKIVAQRAGDLIWRVRVVALSETEILVESPAAAGTTIELDSGLGVVAVMSIGQNRWMFITQTLGYTTTNVGSRTVRVLRLAMPEHVERCQRRNFYRVSTTELTLPSVEVWPILDPTTVGPAEVANRSEIAALLDQPAAATGSTAEPVVLPEVGPKFSGHLMNIGGGGAGLLIAPSDAPGIDCARYFWLRVDLRPEIPAPLAITARLAHTHIDSAQNLYAGMAFEWSFNASHREFVVEQIRRYVTAAQKSQSSARQRAA
jgi:hypothetical protein